LDVLNRGQSALEYLVTYGWAILAIVIIAGVLWDLNIFNPGTFVTGNQCGGFNSFICQDYTMTTAGTLQIVLGNNQGTTLDNLTINGVANCNPVNVAANALTTCNFTYSSLAGGVAGQTYHQVGINMTYVDATSGLSHTDTGFVQGKYG
jgi:hypothetical protein